MSFEVTCHCKKVKVVISAELPTEGMECNCSICKRRGSVLAFYPSALATVTGEDAMTPYTFNKHSITHKFCKECGILPFARADQKGQPFIAVNLRCVEAIDLKTLKMNFVDGAAF